MEQAVATADRLQARDQAIAAGRFGTRQPVVREPAPGWEGERLVSGVRDDWEPAVATDPSDPYVYILTTRLGYPKPCPGNCPIPHISLHVSPDGGRSWDPSTPLCACKGSWQYDPIIDVVRETGDVYAVYLNGFNVLFLKSDDHGETWSDPVKTYGNVSWNDKPAMATSADGRHIYVSWNGPTGGDPWIAQSHDFGETWTQTKLVDGPRYFFAYDGVVLDDGTAILTNSSLSYTGPGGAAEGAVRQHLFISRDRGRTWTNVVVDRVQLGPPCVTQGCYADFHSGHSALSADDDDDLVYVYDGAVVAGGPQRAWVRTSIDGGRSWSGRTALSRPGTHTTAPVVEATGDGDFRSWFVEQNDTGRWNVFHRRSTDGGHVDAIGALVRRDLGRRLQERGRLPRVLRRLRRYRDHEQREDDRRLGRGLQLARPGRGLVQHRRLMGDGPTASSSSPSRCPKRCRDRSRPGLRRAASREARRRP